MSAAIQPIAPVRPEPRQRPGPTRSGRAKLLVLDDQDARALERGETLLTPFGWGLAAVIVERVRTGIAGEPGFQVEVPVVDGRVDIDAVRPSRRVTLAFAPDDLLRVDVRGKVRP